MRFQKGNKPPSHKNNCHCFRCDRKSLVFTEEMRRKISLSNSGRDRKDMRGDKNWNWKGDDVDYTALHDWVNRNLGFAKNWECVYCGSDENLTWANVSREYKRELEDWMPLCKKCHFKYDKQHLRERDWHGRLI